MRIRDPESFLPWIRDRKIRIRDKHPGSPALTKTLLFAYSQKLNLAHIPYTKFRSNHLNFLLLNVGKIYYFFAYLWGKIQKSCENRNNANFLRKLQKKFGKIRNIYVLCYPSQWARRRQVWSTVATARQPNLEGRGKEDATFSFNFFHFDNM